MVIVKLRPKEVEQLIVLLRDGESKLDPPADEDRRRGEYDRGRLLKGSLLGDALRTAKIEDELGIEVKYRLGDFLYWVDQPGERAIVLEIELDPRIPNAVRYTVESDVEEEMNAKIYAGEEDLTPNYDGTPDYE